MKNKPYLLTSDHHAHGWNQFSSTDEDGVNSRLRIMLDQLERAVKTADLAGATSHRMAGDLFHVRGSVKPSVFNPTYEAIEATCRVMPHDCIPGNHDLEGASSSQLGNAMQTLAQIPGFRAVTEVTDLGNAIMFPWYPDLDDLREAMIANADPEKDAIIHAPLNGVIKNMPDHGLEPEELAAMGYRRVFAGHLHDHREFCGGKVYSIGALVHQTWSDVGTKAGFLLVYPDRVEYHASDAPSFIDVTLEFFADLEKHDFSLAEVISGGYCRVKIPDLTEAEMREYRDELEKAGALGVIFVSPKKRVEARKSSVQSGASLEESVSSFTKDAGLSKAVEKRALEIIAEARSV